MDQLLKPALKASYSTNGEARDILQKNNAKLDDKLSNREAKVYLDEKGNPNIAVRGSTTIKDWLISDPLLALGLSRFDPRKQRTDKLIEDVKKKYGKEPNLVGHSLGGALINNANTKGKITTYNKGAGIDEIFKTRKSNQTDVRTSGDLVSALSANQKGGKQITISQPNIFKAHNLKQLKKPKTNYI